MRTARCRVRRKRASAYASRSRICRRWKQCSACWRAWASSPPFTRYRREAQMKSMPDGRGGLKEYPVKAQHELVIANDNLVRFADLIGFSDSEKHARLSALLENYRRAPNRERFVATVESISPTAPKASMTCRSLASMPSMRTACMSTTAANSRCPATAAATLAASTCPSSCSIRSPRKPSSTRRNSRAWWRCRCACSTTCSMQPCGRCRNRRPRRTPSGASGWALPVWATCW